MSLPIANHNQNRLVVEAGLNSIPLDVSLELTHHCNFRCQHCYIPDFSAPDLLSKERVFSLLEELTEMGTLFLTLTGGELFLRKDWFEIAQRARHLGFAVRLFTNGSLIDEEVADAIIELATPVEVSLYSMDKKTFDEITQRPGSFEKTLRGIELLRERNIDVLLKTPMMNHNFRQLDAVAAYAREVGAEFQASPTIMAKKDGDRSTIDLRVPQRDLVPYLGGPHLGCVVPEESQKVGEGPLCAAANRYCNITSAGDVMACNILPGSGGNIRERTFREVWEKSPWLNEVRSIRRESLETCCDCSRLSYCGRCHAQALVEDGSLYGPSSYSQERAEIFESLAAKNRSEECGCENRDPTRVPHEASDGSAGMLLSEEL